ncbi:hypothetical protein CIL03_16100 [Virgibacillus indicus]|uniref:Uncharacterized protein n=1 Tax=Virgibacillus indicus TaxID=2024554 RepID=A0A265N832_9BACI|nr:hypothetical protein [Virgibacillus indicus]OZU87609.1 hypothetical protein CIL03_16100 [Virgibacillus indicus]
MNKFNEREDELLDSLRKQKGMKVSEEAREKSLHAFQKGLKDGEGKRGMSEKSRKYGRKIPGIIAGAAAAGISVLLFLNTGIIDSNQSGAGGNAEIGSEENKDTESDAIKTNDQDEVNDIDLLDKALNRPAFNYNDLNSMPTQKIFNGKIEVHLPSGWTVSETEGDNEFQIQMTGDDGEQMKLLLFDKAHAQEAFDTRIQELTADFKKTEGTAIPVDEFVENISMNREVSFSYPNVVPFDKENTEMTAFYNGESGQFMEMYVSELFGYPMIFTSEFSYDDDDSWNNSIIFFTFMYTGNPPLDIHGSEGENHPVYERPVEKDVILQVGASGVEQVEVELYENNELGLTGYLPKNTDIQRIEHDYFIELRFTEPNVSENSFYSFGKLKDGFPIEKGKEIMFEALDIDLSYYKESDGPIPHHYSYQDAEAFVDGYIQLFEANGEWYYQHKHADRHDYNGGVYIQRLNMFVDSIEWH